MSKRSSSSLSFLDGYCPVLKKEKNGHVARRCVFCGRTFQGGLQRVACHLLNLGKEVSSCKAIPAEKQAELNDLHSMSARSLGQEQRGAPLGTSDWGDSVHGAQGASSLKPLCCIFCLLAEAFRSRDQT